jgi:hypothetical protein
MGYKGVGGAGACQLSVCQWKPAIPEQMGWLGWSYLTRQGGQGDSLSELRQLVWLWPRFCCVPEVSLALRGHLQGGPLTAPARSSRIEQSLAFAAFSPTRGRERAWLVPSLIPATVRVSIFEGLRNSDHPPGNPAICYGEAQISPGIRRQTSGGGGGQEGRRCVSDPRAIAQN